MNRKIDISAIETYLYGMFNGTVSSNTFVGSLPATIKSSWNDMVLIDCGVGIYDHDAYGNGFVLVYLYARPMASGQKNVKAMSTMEAAIDQAISSQDSSGHYYIYRQRTYSDYDNGRNWHFNVVRLGITVK